MNIYEERIAALRALMEANGWDAVVLSGSDPHCSEYPAARWKQVEWLTGFTGEAGDVVVTQSHSGLWTDTRYFIQATAQLAGTGVELHKMRIPGAVGIPQWLAEMAEEKSSAITVAVDGLCWSASAVNEIKDAIKAVSPASCIVSEKDLLSPIWTLRPEIPHSPIRTLDPSVSGVRERFSKLTWLRKQMLRESVDYILLCSLDEIAWLLNIRANDIEYNPYAISYLIVSDDSAHWFVRKSGVDYSTDQETLDSFNELAGDGIIIEDYDNILQSLEDLPSDASLWIDISSTNYHILSHLNELELKIFAATSPIVLKKAIKEASEIAVLSETCIEDGAAMEKFLYWLEHRLPEAPLTEWEASVKLSSLRAEIPDYRGDSFACISAYGASAALPHYCTSEDNPVYLQPKGLYLVDSGGQYLTGTTDITRTIPLGPCTYDERLDYTLVLKAMIDLSMAVFPEGTAGCQIDALAREALWANHRNFGHGTGHGIGFYLGVHEGPHDIRQNFNSQPLLPGMIVSNEPGLYREGLYGIRHENMLRVTQDLQYDAEGNLTNINEFGSWLRFESLTCCHIDTSPILQELLTPAEKSWLNSYNAWVYDTLSSRLTDDELAWLKAKVEAV